MHSQGFPAPPRELRECVVVLENFKRGFLFLKGYLLPSLSSIGIASFSSVGSSSSYDSKSFPTPAFGSLSADPAPCPTSTDQPSSSARCLSRARLLGTLDMVRILLIVYY